MGYGDQYKQPVLNESNGVLAVVKYSGIIIHHSGMGFKFHRQGLFSA